MFNALTVSENKYKFVINTLENFREVAQFVINHSSSIVNCIVNYKNRFIDLYIRIPLTM